MDSYQESKSISYSQYGDLIDIKNAVKSDEKKTLVEEIKTISIRKRPNNINISSYSITTLPNNSYLPTKRNETISFEEEEDHLSRNYIALIDQNKRVTIGGSERYPDKLTNPPNIISKSSRSTSTILTTDYIGQFYIASLTVIGLYIAFRMIKPVMK